MMDNQEIFRHIDHTLLKPDATWEDVRRICEEAQHYRAASACIAPVYLQPARQSFPQLPLTTVIGFPFGFQTTATKLAEAKDALLCGATELDMVIHLGAARQGAFHQIEAEIAALREAAGQHILKVIVETCYLNEEQKITLCHVVSSAGADYIKTSTGFGTSGAMLTDIALFRRHLDKNVRIKAAGGIRSKEEMIAFLQAGADRLGCSAGVNALFVKGSS